ncbi:MAG: aldo/keto reductase [Verrucomicrobiota bacterium]
MQYRELPETEVQPVSAVGFGLWTVSTGWWGTYTDEEAVALMRKARDYGINLYDAADTYGNGRSEELLAKAFLDARDEIVIATKVGYNFYDHGDGRKGQREIPQDFSASFIRDAVDKALKRLKTDRIDILQLHNIKLEQVADQSLWDLMGDLKKEGKILAYGGALGPAIGWLKEGYDAVKKHKPHVMQHIYNLFEQYPGRDIMNASTETDPTRYLIRVTHSSGMLEGHYTEDTVFDENDHRRHRPKSWLINGVKKVEKIRSIMECEGRTMGQAALQWLLTDNRIACCLPNIYNEEQIKEFASTTEVPTITEGELSQLAELWKTNFGVEEEPCNFKGTMTLGELDSEKEAALT